MAGPPPRGATPPASTLAPSRPAWARPLSCWAALVFAAWVVAPFAAAGTLRWTGGWFHLGALATGLAAQLGWVTHHAPGLRQARRRSGPGTPAWDVAWNAAFWPLLASVAVVAGLEFRARGPGLPPVAWPAGLLVLAAGLGCSAWAMSVNPYFEGTARLQRERGQWVIEAGPYRRVRHPGYLGLALLALASPLLLRSAAAAWPAVATVAWLAARTVLEDRLLRRGLPGYRAYCGRTRWRWLPGVW